MRGGEKMKQLLLSITVIFSIMLLPMRGVGEQKVNMLPYKLIAELPEANIQLLAKEEYGWLRDFQIKVGQKTQNFPEWESMLVTKQTKPQLFSVDVTGDGIEEIIVFLIKARGNGLYKNEVHVLEKTTNGEKLLVNEIIIEDPRAVILKNMKMKEMDNGIELIIDDIHALIPYDGSKQDANKIKLSIDHFLKYVIDKNELKAIMLIERKDNTYLGSLIVQYEYKNGILQGKQIEFVRH